MWKPQCNHICTINAVFPKVCISGFNSDHCSLDVKMNLNGLLKRVSVLEILDSWNSSTFCSTFHLALDPRSNSMLLSVLPRGSAGIHFILCVWQGRGSENLIMFLLLLYGSLQCRISKEASIFFCCIWTDPRNYPLSGTSFSSMWVCLPNGESRWHTNEEIRMAVTEGSRGQ